MNIETTLTIPVEDIIQQAQRLQLDPATHDSGEVLELLVRAYVDARRGETQWEKDKEELETERDEACEAQSDVEDKLKRVVDIAARLVDFWEEGRKLRGKAYDTLAEKDDQLASELGDSFSDIASQVAELTELLED